MQTRLCLALVVMLLFAVLASGNPFLAPPPAGTPPRGTPTAGPATGSTTPLAGRPKLGQALAEGSNADRDLLLAGDIVEVRRGPAGEPLWVTHDGRVWRRNPLDAPGEPYLVEVDELPAASPSQPGR